MKESIVECVDLFKMYGDGSEQIPALRGLDLVINKGEFIALIGASGCGKSTLINILNCVIKQTSGKVFVSGLNLLNLSRSGKINYRRQHVGSLMQHPRENLIWNGTVSQNIEIPLKINGINRNRREQRILELLELVGLKEKKDAKIFQLSVGQQQRVGICSAMANEPDLLLMDEPTGDLDRLNSIKLIEELKRIQKEEINTILVVTHDELFSQYIEKSFQMIDGRIAGYFSHKEKQDQEYTSLINSSGFLKLSEENLAHLKNSKYIEFATELKQIILKPKSNSTEPGKFYSQVSSDNMIFIPPNIHKTIENRKKVRIIQGIESLILIPEDN